MSSSVAMYASLLGAVLLHICIGNLSTSGNLIPYLASYMKKRVDPSIGHADIQWVGSAGQIAFGFFGVLSGLMEKKLGTKLSCFVSSLILSCSLLLSYSTVQTSLPLLVVTYGLTFGLGTALNYFVPIYATIQWYPNRPGLATGLVIAGYYAGYTISLVLQMNYLNPKGLPSDMQGYFNDKDLLDRVPSLFLWMALISIVLMTIGSMLISRPNERTEVVVSQDQSINESTSLLGESSQKEVPDLESVDVPDVKPESLIHHTIFYKLWFTHLFNSLVNVSITTTYKSFGETFIQNDAYLTHVGCLGAIINCCGSVCWGLVLDKTSYKTCMLCITASLSILMGTLPLVPLLGKNAYLCWGIFLYFFTVGNLTILPAIMKKIFGQTNAATNVGVLFTAQGVSGVLVAVVLQFLLGRIHYTGCYVLQAFCTCTAMLLTISVPNDL